MRITRIALALIMVLWVPVARAAGHGGEGQDLSGNASQMPASLVGDSGGGPGEEISESGSSGPAPLAAPTTVPNDTVRSVPDKPTGPGQPAVANSSDFVPRSPASFKIYEGAYNADVDNVNLWLKRFAR